MSFPDTIQAEEAHVWATMIPDRTPEFKVHKSEGLANSANSLPRAASGHNLEIVRIEKRGSKRLGYVYYLILNYGIVRYETDIANALASDEVVGIKASNKSLTTNNGLGVADELSKLKKQAKDI